MRSSTHIGFAQHSWLPNSRVFMQFLTRSDPFFPIERIHPSRAYVLKLQMATSNDHNIGWVTWNLPHNQLICQHTIHLLMMTLQGKIAIENEFARALSAGGVQNELLFARLEPDELQCEGPFERNPLNWCSEILDDLGPFIHPQESGQRNWEIATVWDSDIFAHSNAECQSLRSWRLMTWRAVEGDVDLKTLLPALWIGQPFAHLRQPNSFSFWNSVISSVKRVWRFSMCSRKMS